MAANILCNTVDRVAHSCEPLSPCVCMCVCIELDKILQYNEELDYTTFLSQDKIVGNDCQCLYSQCEQSIIFTFTKCKQGWTQKIWNVQHCSGGQKHDSTPSECVCLLLLSIHTSCELRN